MSLDDRTGATILYVAVRDTLKSQGVDVHSHPYNRLDRPSRDVWVAAWHALLNGLSEREHIVCDWRTMKRMLEGDPTAAMWRDALTEVPKLDGESV